MLGATRDFQVFVKPTGSLCNLNCDYCYYLKKQALYAEETSFRMPDDLLETYIAQHFEAAPEPLVRFSWHGGEPTILGLDYFRQIVSIQKKLCPADRRFVNGIQTNGILLDDRWCSFLSMEKFAVGLSLDGPQELHDRYRVDRGGKPTFEQVLKGYRLLQRYNVKNDILCVVNADNVWYPLEVYRFFKQIHASYVSFLPLVEQHSENVGAVSRRTVSADAWGNFLCAIFDEWKTRDIGQVKVQIFEEAARSAFGQQHSLCIFRETCGDIPVVEYNGDFYSCDHFVNTRHHLGNIRHTPLVALLEHPAQVSFGKQKRTALPQFCRECQVLEMCNGECPKNRFVWSPNGEPGLNYLCAGYRRFFNHCRPFVDEIASVWKQQKPDSTGLSMPKKNIRRQVGRNDQCPCGSWKKYKMCCMRKGS